MSKIEFHDVDGDLVNITMEDGLDGSSVFSLDLRVGVGVLSLDVEKAKFLLGILSHYIETGELPEPTEKSVEDSWRAAQERRVSELQAQIDELKASIGQCCKTGIEVLDGSTATKEHVREIDQRIKSIEESHRKDNSAINAVCEVATSLQSYVHKIDKRLKSVEEDRQHIIDCLRALGVFAGWETGRLSESSELRNKCTAWLSEGDVKWGLWWDNDGRWVIYNGDIYKAKSKEAAEYLKRSFCNPDGITAYPYPADGGMPVELREKQLEERPQLWGVWGISGWFKLDETDALFSSEKLAADWVRMSRFIRGWEVIPYDANKKPSGSKEPKG